MIMNRLIMLSTIFLFSSCYENNDELHIRNQLYYYQFPSQHIMTLEFSDDDTFNQKMFKSKEDYNNDKEEFNNFGHWEKTNDGLTLHNWIIVCYLRSPDSILTNREPSHMQNVYWRNSPSSITQSIIIYEETGYILNRINNY